MICASIISHRTAESQSAGGGQTHNETESSHSTASLIFILGFSYYIFVIVSVIVSFITHLTVTDKSKKTE